MEKIEKLGDIRIDCSDWSISVRYDTYAVSNGVDTIGPVYHRVMYYPRDGVTDKMPDVVKLVASTLWTEEVVKSSKDTFKESIKRAQEEAGNV